jgi:hypothetical protein
MVTACLISSILTQELPQSLTILEENESDQVDAVDGPSLEELYNQGESNKIVPVNQLLT